MAAENVKICTISYQVIGELALALDLICTSVPSRNPLSLK